MFRRDLFQIRENIEVLLSRLLQRNVWPAGFVKIENFLMFISFVDF